VNSLKPLIWVCGIGLMVVLFRPTAVILAVGLLPTVMTLLFDRTPEKFGVLCIGSLNCAGLYPILMPLWTRGHTMELAMKTLADPNTGAVIVGAAAVGCGIYFSTPPIVSLVMKFALTRQIKELEQRQKDLVTYWGEALTQDAGLGAPTATAGRALKHTPVRPRH